MRGDTLCHAAFDAVTKSSRALTRDPGIPAFVISHSNAAPWSCRLRCGHQVIPRFDAGSREYRLYTAGNRPGSRDARPVHPTSNLYPQRSMSSFPLFFSRKRKGKAKRKLPADVRKLKNGCAVRGERTRRARLESAIQSVIPLRAPRPLHPGSNIFSPRSSLSVIFLSAFSHRPVYLRLSSSAMNWTPHRCAG